MFVAYLHFSMMMAAADQAAIVPVPPAAVTAAPAPPLMIFARPTPSGAAPLTVPKGTRVMIEIDDSLTSDLTVPGTRFALHLADDVMIDGWPVLAAGATGEGEVVHAAKAGWGGKPGELIINARFIDCGAVRVPLGKMRWSGRGVNKTGEAMAAMMVFSPAMFMVSGGNLSVPRGTRAEAGLLADVPLSAIVGSRCAPAPVNQNSTGSEE